jgi:inner membrane protein
MKHFAIRCIYLLFLLALLWVASLYIREIVNDRLNNREQARQSIKQSFPGTQTIAGPFLAFVYEEKYTLEVIEGSDAKPMKVLKPMVQLHTHYVLPDKLSINNEMETRQRTRGIFKVNTFNSKVKLDGNWIMPTAQSLARLHSNSTLVLPKTGTVFLGVEDARGLSEVAAKLDNTTVRPESNIKRMGGLPSVQFELPIGFETPSVELTKKIESEGSTKPSIPFELSFDLSGTDSIQYVPLARENKVRLTSDWPHPSFEGAALPLEKDSSGKGFTAQWNVSSLSSEAPSTWLRRLKGNRTIGQATNPADAAQAAIAATQEIADSVDAGQAAAPDRRYISGDQRIRQSGLYSFGVRLIDPVDVYTLSDRATKYAMFFILLTIGAFVLFELFKRLQIHPVQYLLVGAALLMFFLLLISLSEHYGFDRAYFSASFACTALIGFYAAYSLNSWKRALPLGIGLSLLYGCLYQILQSEDKALLMGTLLLFAILATLMVGTRKTNWYHLLERKS